MLLTGSSQIDAERAFDQVARARRRASLIRRLRRACAECSRLLVYERTARPAAPAGGRRILEIPLDAIHATVEPSRATQFDHDFRPFPLARVRWKQVWLAEHRGAVLPPISVIPFRDGYAVRDGHHRISVARARGALTIDALVEGI